MTQQAVHLLGTFIAFTYIIVHRFISLIWINIAVFQHLERKEVIGG